MVHYVLRSFVLFFFFLMIRRPPRATRTDTLFPYTTLFRSGAGRAAELLLRDEFGGAAGDRALAVGRDLRLAPVGDRHGEQILVAHKTDPPSVGRDIEVDFRRFAGRQPPRLGVRRRRIKVAVERKGQERAEKSTNELQ